MNKKNLTTAWITLLIFVIGLTAWIMVVCNMPNPDNPKNADFSGVLGIGMIIIIVDLVFWLCYAWETNIGSYLTVRIMYVNRWSSSKKEYETVYFTEWEYNVKKYFMGIRLKNYNDWTTTNYKYDDGYDCKDEAVRRIFSYLKEVKDKDIVREIKEIEVFIIADELQKLTLE